MQFHEKMTQNDCDVVYGVLIKRKGGWFERWSGALYYKVLCSLLRIDIPENVATARLMTRRFVDVLLQYDEREMILGGLFSLAGFDQVPMGVKKHSKSETTYSIQDQDGVPNQHSHRIE